MRNGGLFGNGNNGSSLGPLASMVNNNDGRDLLMQAINGNGAALQNLASMFSTKVDIIQAAINQANNSITQCGCKIDASTGALLNAGTQNTMTLANQLATCCCNIKTAVTEGNYQNQIATIQQTDALKESVGGVGNAVSNGFANMSFALRDQTCNIEKVVDGVGDRIIDKLNASEKSAMQDKINALQTQLTTEHQSGVIAQQIAAAVNPIAATVYDQLFAANMCKADYLGSSITDDLHLCMYVKGVLDDVDGYEGLVFNRWYADMCRKGISVDWYECR